MNTYKIEENWKKVNVTSSTRGKAPICIEFTQENGDKVAYELSRSTASWLSKGLKNAVKLKNT